MTEYNLKRMENQEVLITGGMGAIGSNLAHTALGLGANVTIFDNLMKDTGANPANIKEIKDRIKVIKRDIRDAGKVRDTVRDKDIIFNCAGQVSHVLSMKDPFLDIDINCKGHINVLEACRKVNDSAKILFTGSRSQFGETKTLPLSEGSVDNPADILSADNLAGEHYHTIYNRVYGLPTTTLRLTNTYGPRGQVMNPGYSVVNWLIGRAIQDQDLTIFRPGKQLRDINYMQDVVDAMILASQSSKAAGETFVLGTGKGVCLTDIAKAIVKTAGTGRVTMVPWPKDRKKIEAGDIVISYGKIQKLLGWYPKTSLESGIKETLDFFREHSVEYFPKNCPP